MLQVVVQVVLWTVLAVLIGCGVLVAIYVVVFFGPHFWLPRDRGGQIGEGLVLWVEPIRFLGRPWGERTTPAGLRKAGYGGKFEYWKWHSAWRGCLVLPALMDRELAEREARRLAGFIADYRRRLPESPIYLIGYSGGAFVAVRALELLPSDVCVQSAALVQATMDPRRDLASALSHVTARLVVTASVMDLMLSGLAAWVFAGPDRVHTPAMGLLGARQPTGIGLLEHPKLTQIHWRPCMLLEGLFGLHDWCMPPRFVARYLAPAMAIC